VKLKKRVKALEARVAALEQHGQRWTPDPPPAEVSDPVDAQAIIRWVADEYSRSYEMWGDDEWRGGVYL
jgi:hypothetical protein